MPSAHPDPLPSAAGEPDLPRVSPRLFSLFGQYSRWYLGRHFHAVRRSGAVPDVLDETPLVVYFNHPSWWDPLLAILLARSVFPRRTHYGPIDAVALEQYGFFRRLGFFGVEAASVSGARRFLRVAGELLSRPGTALWITPEGRFTDPRRRPVRLRPGLGRLAARLASEALKAGRGEVRGGVLIPLAVEYPFWEERFPEALLRFGEPVDIAQEVARRRRRGEKEPSPREWDALLAARLEAAQDALAKAALERDPGAFETMVGGRAGVGGVYDLWRRLRARLRGERFEREHGASARRSSESPGEGGSDDSGGEGPGSGKSPPGGTSPHPGPGPRRHEGRLRCASG